MSENFKELKERIINYMENQGETSYFVNDISEGLALTSTEQFKEIVKALAALERDRRIMLTKDGQFKLLEPEPAFIGRFSATERGFGFVAIPDFEKDIYISPNDVDTALNGDTVQVKITKDAQPWNDRAAEGKIIDIVERGTTTIIGEFHAYTDEEVKDYQLYGYVSPEDRKQKHLTVQIEAKGIRPVEGQIILVDITHFPRYKDEDLKGITTKVVGHRDDPGIDILSIAYKHGIDPEFPEEVLTEVEEIPDEVLPEEMEGRKDLRGQKIVTIDGEDAKDLDDAINVEILENGNYFLGVHIADVSHYVQAGTALDDEAYERGTSSYLIDRVIPMLPQKLSNGICSLHPNADRLTLSCDMEFNHRGEVVNYDIYPSIISSYRRMSYNDINGILMEQDLELMKEHEDLVEMFQQMEELHNILERKREKNGAITFDSTELDFEVDEKGKPLKINIVERGVGERMIESFMLSANETVSKHFSERDLPFLYRVHEQPDEAKMQNFLEFTAALGVRVKGKKDTISPKVLQSVLDEVAGEPYEQVVNMLMLRSMQQAKYDVEPLGHYGLATEFYSHFTAPIRRYPDLVLHRLIHYYQEVGTDKRTRNYWAEELPEIAEHSSQAERRAVDAEREVEDLKMAEYMIDKVGMEFEAQITSITNFGMFVQVEGAVEGLVHLSTMKKDYYEFNERGMILVGQRTGQVFRIGEKVDVKLINVDVDRYDIDFELIEAASDKKKKGNGASKKKRPKDQKAPRNVEFEIRGRDKQKKRKKRRNQRKQRKN